MSNMHPLLAAIGDEPQERSRWLVWADWLDENGREPEAAAWRWMAKDGFYPAHNGWHWIEHDPRPPHIIGDVLFCGVYLSVPYKDNLTAICFRSDRDLQEGDPFTNLCWLAEAVAKLGVPE